MAEVPRYTLAKTPISRQSAAGLSATGYLAQRDEGRARTFAGLAAVDAGGALVNFGLDLARRTDAVNSFERWNSLRDEARQKMSEMQQRKGEDPGVLSQEYTQWYEDRFKHYQNQLDSDPARQMFYERSMRSRRSDLDVLANYESREIKRRVAEQEASTIATTEMDIREYGRLQALNSIEESLTSLKDALVAFHPGEDISAMWAETEQALRAAAANEMISTATSQGEVQVALNFIEDHKDALGAGYQKLLEQGQEKMMIEMSKPIIAQGQWESAIDSVRKTEGVSEASKSRVVSWIKVQRKEAEFRRNQEEKDNLEAVSEEFYAAMNTGNISEAATILDKGVSTGRITQRAKFAMGKHLESATKLQTNTALEKQLMLKVYDGSIRNMSEIYENPNWIDELNLQSLEKLRVAIIREQRDPSHYSQPISIARQTWRKKYAGTPYEAMESRFYGMLMSEIESAEAREERRLTREEINKITEYLLKDEEVEGNFWGIFGGEQTTLFEERMREQALEPEPHRMLEKESRPPLFSEESQQRDIEERGGEYGVTDMSVEGIPQDALLKIRQAFTARGVPWTDATVRAFYDDNKDVLEQEITSEAEPYTPALD